MPSSHPSLGLPLLFISFFEYGTPPSRPPSLVCSLGWVITKTVQGRGARRPPKQCRPPIHHLTVIFVFLCFDVGGEGGEGRSSYKRSLFSPPRSFFPITYHFPAKSEVKLAAAEDAPPSPRLPCVTTCLPVFVALRLCPVCAASRAMKWTLTVCTPKVLGLVHAEKHSWGVLGVQSVTARPGPGG